MIRNALYAALLGAVCSTVHAQSVVGTAGLLTDAAGRVLYTFDKDSGGKSMCNGECAKNWPPLMVSKDDEAPKDKWTHVTRDDGSMQWAYDGKPLYTFIKDKKAGDKTGDGMKDVWHIAKP